jgi:hypothetical protein
MGSSKKRLRASGGVPAEVEGRAVGREETNHAAMGRLGNVMLVGGETDLSLRARPGEVVRFYLTNTANTRVFNMAVPGARMKLVGGDSGRCPRPGSCRFSRPVRDSPSPGDRRVSRANPRRAGGCARRAWEIAAEGAFGGFATAASPRISMALPRRRIGVILQRGGRR